MIPEQSVDYIMVQQSGGRTFYEEFASRPAWHGGPAGITIGIGYDLGQIDAPRLTRDWNGLLTPETLGRLAPAIGLRGDDAAGHYRLQGLTRQLRDVVIPWTAATQVFREVTVPALEAQVLAAFPGAAGLPPLCVGALVSLVYSRGLSLAGPNRVEMLRIRSLIQAGRPEEVPDQFRAMMRLWPRLPGLQKRRVAEAEMFQQGLEAHGTAAVA